MFIIVNAVALSRPACLVTIKSAWVSFLKSMGSVSSSRSGWWLLKRIFVLPENLITTPSLYLGNGGGGDLSQTGGGINDSCF